MMGHWYGNYGWIGLIFNLLLTIGFIVGIIFLVVWIVKEINKNNGKNVKKESSLIEIVKERYAKGEITRDEYLNLLTDLGIR